MWRWRERSARCSTNRAGSGAVGCAGCWDEAAGTGRPAVPPGLSGGGRTGAVLRIFAAPAAKTRHFWGPSVSGGGLLGLAVLGFRHLRRGLSRPGPSGPGPGRTCMGSYGWEASAAGFSVFLENTWKNVPLFSVAPEKNIENHENFVCICGKMGYNRME